jgi:nicotinamidase/pyrazinamidase
MAHSLTIGANDVLLVIDMQNDFMPGGALAVADGDAIVPLVNRIAGKFANVILTQDWHPNGHASFASSHPGAKPFETTTTPYGTQILWPDHCVQGGMGAQLHEGLKIDHAILVLRKGANANVDSYSAFTEADRATSTGLAALLRARGISRVFICGLATDFCVAWSALDARASGFETFVIADACRGIDTNDSLANAWKEMDAAAVRGIDSSQFGS